MPLIDVQERYRELGRIRLGKKGDRHPVKLETFRFTSPDRNLIDRIAHEWGGTVNPWESPRGQEWEVVTDTARIDCLVPPQRITDRQFYELWGKDPSDGPKAPVRLLRRCDGQLQDDGTKCVCDPDNRTCKPRTHLVVMLPQIPGLGVWRVATGSVNAAATLPKTADVLARLAEAGAIVKAVLMIVHGRGVIDGQTVRYTYPALDLPQTAAELSASLPPGVAERVLTGGDTPTAAVGGASGRPSLPPRPAAAALPTSPQPISTPDDGEGFAPGGPVPQPDVFTLQPGEEVKRKMPPVPEMGSFGEVRSINETDAVSIEPAPGDTTPELWSDDISEHLAELPEDGATMQVWESWLRTTFDLMEAAGVWHALDDGTDPLHASLWKHHKVPHVGDLRKAQLVAFAKRAHSAATEALT